MSKSILVIDTPESCSKCPLFFGAYTDMVCKANGRTIDYPYPDNKVQDWCPLKELPKQKPFKAMGEWLNFNCGFNACLDRILGEE